MKQWPLVLLPLLFPVCAMATPWTGNPTCNASVYRTVPNTWCPGSFTWQLYQGGSMEMVVVYDTSGIPAYAIVDSATLTVHTAPQASSNPCYVHRILSGNANISASALTYNYQDGAAGGHRWAGHGDGYDGCSEPGVDYATAIMGTFTPTATNSPYTITLDPTEVQNMLAANYGMIIYQNTSDNPTFEDTYHYDYNSVLAINYHEVPTNTPTATATATQTETETATQTAIATATATQTATATFTPTANSHGHADRNGNSHADGDTDRNSNRDNYIYVKLHYD